MKSSSSQLWQIIRAREKSLAATKAFYVDWIQQEQNRRNALELELKRLGELRAQAERQIAAERDGRRQEMVAKDKALQANKAEFAARTRWEKLCHEAEEQLDALRRQLATEAKAHVASILNKLGASDRTDAATQAVRRGFVRL